jgi:hypothetical protein
MAAYDPKDLAEALGRELSLLDSPAAKKVLKQCFNDDVGRPNCRNRLWLICNADEPPTVYTDGAYVFAIIGHKGKGPLETNVYPKHARD